MFVRCSRAIAFHRAVHQLCQRASHGFLMTAGTVTVLEPPSVVCLSLCHPGHWAVAQVDTNIVSFLHVVFSNTYPESASLQQLVQDTSFLH